MNIIPQLGKNKRYKVASIQGFEALNGPCKSEVNGEKTLTTKSRNIHVSGFSIDITSDILETFFSKFGKIIRVSIPRDDEGNSKSYGFVDFESVAAQQSALSKTNYEINGQAITVRPSFRDYIDKKQEMQRDNQIFVSSLPTWMTHNEIKNYFTNFGQIIGVYQPNESKINYCFVKFMSHESVKKALEHENHKLMGQEIVVKRAFRRNELKTEPAIEMSKKLQLIPGTYTTIAELIKNLESKERATLEDFNYFS